MLTYTFTGYLALKYIYMFPYIYLLSNLLSYTNTHAQHMLKCKHIYILIPEHNYIQSSILMRFHFGQNESFIT